MENSYSAPAVEKLVDIMELFTTENRGFGANEISRLLNIPVNTVFRICTTMEKKGYFIKDPHNASYQLSPKFFTLGQMVGDRIELRVKALTVMKKLRDQMGETVHLCVLRETWMVLLDKVETLNKIRIDVESGSLLYPHASAFGKCLMAYAEADHLKRITDQGLKALTSNTIGHFPRLAEELDRVKTQGYAFDMEEYMEGIRCVGAPVHSSEGMGVAAVGIMGPAYRLSPEKMRDSVERVRSAARELSQDLGYVPPR